MPKHVFGRFILLLSLVAAAGLAAADSNDWVNVQYVLSQAGTGGSGNTASARQGIISSAGNTAKSGPWSIVAKSSANPPSGNSHDYLSWAPYHWPACNWCSKGTTHLSNPSPEGDDSGDDPDDGTDGSGDDPDPSQDGDSGGGESEENFSSTDSPSATFSDFRRRGFGVHRRIARAKRAPFPHQEMTSDDTPRELSDEDDTKLPRRVYTLDVLPTALIPGFPSQPSSVAPPQPTLTGGDTSTSYGTINGTPAPAQAPAKTQHSSCTPSPTKSMAPSATWTTCPYEAQDGKVNPDVRTLPDSPAIVSVSQSVLYNSVAYVLQKTSVFSQNAAGFIDTFFLAPATAMHPNMNFGQLVRGPGKDNQVGTFTGILDLRGLVKIVNAIQMLKSVQSPDWTPVRDKAMSDWMTQYTTWLTGSPIGQETASKANNHLSFYVNQLTAAKMLLGDTNGAVTALHNYFSNQYLDQIAASGEQPFEAVRTRPYHYRCFNLEAMITNAKMGDQLGLNFWNAKSKYGATIQTALDYTMALDPKGEDVSDIFPHVAAVAAAYGDPKGKYHAFLQKQVSSYQSMPFWFYDQTAALPNAPASHSAHSREVREYTVNSTLNGLEEMAWDVVNSAVAIPFECPAVFDSTPEVEVDDGIFVTCDQLKPFYEIPAIPLDTDTDSS
ncbi:chondroitin AC/alginate lyase [Amylocystis lapponica]|nr:chondroitin AC/alginate lyase [Amylocystis lapponica]